MRIHKQLFWVALLFSLLFCQTNTTAQSPTGAGSLKVTLRPIASGLDNPVYMTQANDGSGRQYILLQEGIIKVLENGKVLEAPFLDIRDHVDHLLPAFTEMGLLGLAFHPKYSENKRFFVYYTNRHSEEGSGCIVRLSEFKASEANPYRSDPASERVLMEIFNYGFFVVGGQLSFGPDGMLYVGVGTGSGEEARQHVQKLDTKNGAILRIDVDGNHPYGVPSDNPFVDSSAPEIWAYGLRNPYRFSFDSKTGELICGDVGDQRYEEIDRIEKGGNYGWPVFESKALMENQNADSLAVRHGLPSGEYIHELGVGSAIVGSYVYRGRQYPHMEGKVIIADWSGDMFFMDGINSGQTKEIVIENLSDFALEERKVFEDEFGKMILPKYQINSLSVDGEGELYVVGQKGVGASFEKSGSVFKIEFGK